MILKFTLLDLSQAFRYYSAGLVRHIEELDEDEKKENFLYLKAIQEFLFYFTDEYCNNIIEAEQKYTNDIFTAYKEKYFSKSYTVKAYGQEFDATTAEPVILKNIIAADDEELRRKVRERASKESYIYSLTDYEVLSCSDILLKQQEEKKNGNGAGTD